jgi:hypothetical protein
MEMGVWDETLERWHGEGLPSWVTSLRHLEDYLRLDRSFNVNWLPINHRRRRDIAGTNPMRPAP